MLPVEVKSVVDRCVRDLREVMKGSNLEQLKDKRWNELEGPAVEAGDLVAQQLLQALLEEQAGEVGKATAVCPVCGAALEVKPDESQPLQTRRGWVSWRQPVRRCPRCRRDFFPSGAKPGL
jgi:uncharacterized protein with PIN domain